jgi:hypothetical protein
LPVRPTLQQASSTWALRKFVMNKPFEFQDLARLRMQARAAEGS